MTIQQINSTDQRQTTRSEIHHGYLVNFASKMLVPTIALRENTRMKLSFFLAVIVWTLVAGGLILAGIAAYVKWFLTGYTDIVEGYDGSLGLTGITVTIVNSLGGVYLHIVRDPNKRQANGKMFSGFLAGFALVTIILLTAGIFCLTQIGNIEGGIAKAMGIYRGEYYILQIHNLL